MTAKLLAHGPRNVILYQSFNRAGKRTVLPDRVTVDYFERTLGGKLLQ